MTLQHELAVLRADFARRATPERVSLYEAKIEELRRSGILDAAFGAGQQAPGFALPGVDGATVRLSDLLAQGPAVVTFYRGGWCPYCTLQLRAYQTMLPDLAARGARLVAISPQTWDRSSATAGENTLGFDVLSDEGSRVARAYGLVFQLPPDLQEAYTRNGTVLPEINGDGEWRLPVPATFVIEQSGRVALSYVDVDYRNRLEAAEILATLRSLDLGAAA